MKIGAKTALVLEGGGLRGVFTCGVLDCFMDRGIRFPFTIGVSAGACNGLSYVDGIPMLDGGIVDSIPSSIHWSRVMRVLWSFSQETKGIGRRKAR